jgi:hypothetical protein
MRIAPAAAGAAAAGAGVDGVALATAAAGAGAGSAAGLAAPPPAASAAVKLANAATSACQRHSKTNKQYVDSQSNVTILAPDAVDGCGSRRLLPARHQHKVAYK